MIGYVTPANPVKGVRKVPVDNETVSGIVKNMCSIFVRIWKSNISWMRTTRTIGK